METSLLEPLGPLPETPFITIIIPVYNEERYLVRCLQSVLAQEYPAQHFEILVVDGGSTDRTREIVADFQKRYPQVKLLHNPDKIVSTAMNTGIRHADERCDVVVRVDGHTILAPDYLKMCVHYLKKTGAHNVGGNMNPVGDGYIGDVIAMAMRSRLAVGNAKFRYAQEEQPIDTVYLGAFRREVFDRIGLFNEELIRNQDYELNYRIRKAGGQVFLAPAIKSWYMTRTSLTNFAVQYFFYGYWKTQMLKQHPRSLRPRQLVPPLFVSGLVTSALLGLFIHPVAYLFISIAVSYSFLALVFAVTTAHRHGWRYLPILPLTFATMHLSWGLGFLWGLVRRPKPPAQEVSAAHSAAPAREEPAAERGVPGS